MHEPDDAALPDRIAAGDATAVQPLLRRYRARLRRMVPYRLDVRVAARRAASDVVQEALLTASTTIQAFARQQRHFSNRSRRCIRFMGECFVHA